MRYLKKWWLIIYFFIISLLDITENIFLLFFLQCKILVFEFGVFFKNIFYPQWKCRFFRPIHHTDYPEEARKQEETK